MSKQLPENPCIEFLKKEAKQLKKLAEDKNEETLSRFSKIFEDIYCEPKLTDAQFVLAKEYGFASWNKLREFVELSSPLGRAVRELRAGKGVILFDNEGRENEGDFVFPAEFVSPEQINFMSKFGRGTICVAISHELALQKGFKKQAETEQSLEAPPFAQSIDHRLTSTGISINDRHLTISSLAEDGSTIQDFRTPGHMQTLIARKNGLKDRKGHTEGSVTLMKKAGLKSLAVICEIVKDDGSMARMQDLLPIAKSFGMELLTISDLG